MSEVKPMLRIRANASENVKGIVSCECSVEMALPFDHLPILLDEDIATRIEQQLRTLHRTLRQEGHKLAVDGGT